MFNLTSILFYAHVVLGFCFINFAFTSKDLTDESSGKYNLYSQILTSFLSKFGYSIHVI